MAPPGFFVEWIRPPGSLNTNPLYGITMVLPKRCQLETGKLASGFFMAASGFVIGQPWSRTNQEFP
jgi:hypothetical protein